METLNNAAKARGIILVIVCLALTISGGEFMIDQPATEQTADLLRIHNLRFAAYLSAFLLSTVLSIVITFFIGLMIPGYDQDTTNGLTSNPISKAIWYIGLTTWGIGIVVFLITEAVKLLGDI